MSKTLPATFKLATNSVEVDGVPGVPILNATILSQGKADSVGTVILDEVQAFYVADTAPDLVTTLEKLIDVLSQVSIALDKAASAITSLDTAGFLVAATAGVPGLPVTVADVAEISGAKAQIDAIKSDVTALKGALR